ncbi:MAG: hypothetical protein EZS28_011630 [Streblomastix strix]|uniref:Uncharacterized protein n=1 Tax=Streblomastix strix TaxID=222440 RepID=A0A5J4WD10_9EUKA|nr:MAG: hypothetical protein EZS28_011630 [Streblomastix strix]
MSSKKEDPSVLLILSKIILLIETDEDEFVRMNKLLLIRSYQELDCDVRLIETSYIRIVRPARETKLTPLLETKVWGNSPP